MAHQSLFSQILCNWALAWVLRVVLVLDVPLVVQYARSHLSTCAKLGDSHKSLCSLKLCSLWCDNWRSEVLPLGASGGGACGSLVLTLKCQPSWRPWMCSGLEADSFFLTHGWHVPTTTVFKAWNHRGSLWNISHYRIRTKKLLPKYFLWNMCFECCTCWTVPGASRCWLSHLLWLAVPYLGDRWVALCLWCLSSFLCLFIPNLLVHLYLTMHPRPCPCPFAAQSFACLLCSWGSFHGAASAHCICTHAARLLFRGCRSLDFQCPSESVHSQSSLPGALM